MTFNIKSSDIKGHLLPFEGPYEDISTNRNRVRIPPRTIATVPQRDTIHASSKMPGSVCARCGVSRPGEPSTLDTFLRIALALDLGDAILGAIPTGQIRPIERVSRIGSERRRAPPATKGRPGPRPGHGVTTRMTDANVILWGRRIGAVSWDETRSLGVFQYDPAFAGAGIEVAPLTMPARETPYEFPALNRETFRGLPGMLADALPDRFGNRLIDAWLAETGTSPEAFNPVDRLCYIGRRGIGALEFEPALRKQTRAKKLEVARLVDLANRALDERANLAGRLDGENDADPLEDILSVGTSAGGARAKAVLAWNPKTGEFRSGQLDADAGFEHWLLKFDGVSNNRDKELADPQGYGKIEYAYSAMARAASITMSECRLHHEGGRSHFMTKRFGPGRYRPQVPHAVTRGDAALRLQ